MLNSLPTEILELILTEVLYEPATQKLSPLLLISKNITNVARSCIHNHVLIAENIYGAGKLRKSSQRSDRDRIHSVTVFKPSLTAKHLEALYEHPLDEHYQCSTSWWERPRPDSSSAPKFALAPFFKGLRPHTLTLVGDVNDGRDPELERRKHSLFPDILQALGASASELGSSLGEVRLLDWTGVTDLYRDGSHYNTTGSPPPNVARALSQVETIRTLSHRNYLREFFEHGNQLPAQCPSLRHLYVHQKQPQHDLDLYGEMIDRHTSSLATTGLVTMTLVNVQIPALEDLDVQSYKFYNLRKLVLKDVRICQHLGGLTWGQLFTDHVDRWASGDTLTTLEIKEIGYVWFHGNGGTWSSMRYYVPGTILTHVEGDIPALCWLYECVNRNRRSEGLDEYEFDVDLPGIETKAAGEELRYMDEQVKGHTRWVDQEARIAWPWTTERIDAELARMDARGGHSEADVVSALENMSLSLE